MAELKETPRNAALGMIADSLTRVRDFGDKAKIPFTEMGLGELFMGKTPEEVNEWSYGNSPLQVVGGGTGSMIPQLKQGRGQQLLDTGFSAVDASALAQLPKFMLRTAFSAPVPGSPLAQMGAIDNNKRNFFRNLANIGEQTENPLNKLPGTPEEPVDTGRRNVLKALGVGALSAAAPALIKGVTKESSPVSKKVIAEVVSESSPVSKKIITEAARAAKNVIAPNVRIASHTLTDIADFLGYDSAKDLADVIGGSGTQLLSDMAHVSESLQDDIIKTILKEPVEVSGVPEKRIKEILGKHTPEELKHAYEHDLPLWGDIEYSVGSVNALAHAYPENASNIRNYNELLGHLYDPNHLKENPYRTKLVDETGNPLYDANVGKETINRLDEYVDDYGEFIDSLYE